MKTKKNRVGMRFSAEARQTAAFARQQNNLATQNGKPATHKAYKSKGGRK